MLAAWLACALVACCQGTQSPELGCSTDGDCREARVCRNGTCADVDGSAVDRTRSPEGARPAEPAAGWARGGPGHSGSSPFLGPTTEPRLLWEVDVGAVVFATPTILVDANGDEVAYVGAHSGRFVGVVVAGARAGKLVLDLDLGGRVWTTAAAADDGRVFVGTDDDTLVAIDTESGTRAWSLPIGGCQPAGAPGPEGSRCDVDGGPTLALDGDLYVGADGVYRVSTGGELRWHWPAGGASTEKATTKEDGDDSSAAPRDAAHVFSSPLVSAEGHVYFGGQDGYVTSLTSEGEERWRFKVGNGADVDGSPAWDPSGGIFVGADDGRVLALRTDGTLRWSFAARKDIRSAIAVGPDGSVYVTSFDRHLYALSPAGELRWKLATGGVVHSSPVVDGAGTIYFGSQDDRLYAVSAAGELLWDVELPGDVDASVAIAADGTLVVGCDDGRLRAYVAR